MKLKNKLAQNYVESIFGEEIYIYEYHERANTHDGFIAGFNKAKELIHKIMSENEDSHSRDDLFCFHDLENIGEEEV